VWTVGLTIEIKLGFQISLAELDVAEIWFFDRLGKSDISKFQTELFTFFFPDGKGTRLKALLMPLLLLKKPALRFGRESSDFHWPVSRRCAQALRCR